MIDAWTDVIKLSLMVVVWSAISSVAMGYWWERNSKERLDKQAEALRYKRATGDRFITTTDVVIAILGLLGAIIAFIIHGMR